MKKVLVMTSTFPRWKNDSTPSFVYDLHTHMKKYQFVVVAPHHKGAKNVERMSTLSVRRFSYFFKNYQKLAYGAGMITNARNSFLAKFQIPLFLQSQYNKAQSIIEKENIQGIHAHWAVPQGILAAKLSKKYGIPLILTIHGTDIFGLQGSFFRNLQRAVVNQAAAITVNSNATKKELIRLFPACRRKVSVLSMGIDTSLFKKMKVTKSKKKTILFVGRLNEQKGVQYLIKSLPLVLKKSDVELVVVGSGEYRKKLGEIAESLSVRKSVHFVGAKGKKELVQYYNQADVFVLPSITSKIGTEGFGLVLAEAMSCGVPVIGSSSGGIPEVISHNRTGIIVKEKNSKMLADVILRVLNNKDFAKKIAKNGQTFSRENYSWKKIAKRFEDIYRRAL